MDTTKSKSLSDDDRPERSEEFLLDYYDLCEIHSALENAIERADLDAQQDKDELRAAIETLKTARGNLGDTYE